jgi:hypothetical protein
MKLVFCLLFYYSLLVQNVNANATNTVDTIWQEMCMYGKIVLLNQKQIPVSNHFQVVLIQNQQTINLLNSHDLPNELEGVSQNRSTVKLRIGNNSYLMTFTKDKFYYIVHGYYDKETSHIDAIYAFPCCIACDPEFTIELVSSDAFIIHYNAVSSIKLPKPSGKMLYRFAEGVLIPYEWDSFATKRIIKTDSEGVNLKGYASKSLLCSKNIGIVTCNYSLYSDTITKRQQQTISLTNNGVEDIVWSNQLVEDTIQIDSNQVFFDIINEGIINSSFIVHNDSMYCYICITKNNDKWIETCKRCFSSDTTQAINSLNTGVFLIQSYEQEKIEYIFYKTIFVYNRVPYDENIALIARKVVNK